MAVILGCGLSLDKYEAMDVGNESDRSKRSMPPYPFEGDQMNAVEHDGLAQFERLQRAWTAKPEGFVRPPPKHVLDFDLLYDDILLSSKPFPERIPLCEMVEFLVEEWDEQGLL